MTSQERALFDANEYGEGDDPRILIPEATGSEVGTFFRNPRFVKVYLETGTNIFLPDNGGELASDGYAKDSEYEEDFAQWSTVGSSLVERDGYLAGFPALLTPDENVIKCLHLWSHNSDIFSETYALPLLALTGLLVYSRQQTKLLMELDELSMGAESRYQIPLLRQKTSGDMIYRDAEPEDIVDAIEKLDDAPTLIYGTHGSLNAFRMLPEEQLTELFKGQ
jgi:hypothetical protein